MSDIPLQLQLDLPGLQQNLQVLDPTFWRGCFNARENSMHQLSPYVGKMKSGMVRALLLVYSQEGETVLDPYKAAVLVLGDYRRNGNAADSAETIASLASQLFPEKFVVEAIIDDPIPDERRSRRRTRTTSKDRVLVLRKKK
jgi:hypothetical protein